jgi:glutamine amidotransferase
MCRLFGFRSVIPSMVHRSLLETENALGRQSVRHPDGWGVAHYVDGAPHVTRSAEAAHDCRLFRRVSGVVASETVVAHVRKATVGNRSLLNSHPFQHGRWVFAHNGEIPGFDQVRDALLARVDADLAAHILGETDSEALFHLFLTVMRKQNRLDADVGAEAVADGLARTEVLAREVCDGVISQDRLRLNFMVTNGRCLVASRAGKELHWASHKTRCADRDRCPAASPACEAPSATGEVRFLAVSSEPLGGENVWQEVPDGHVVGVDADMRLFRRKLGFTSPAERRLRVV